MGTCVEPLPVTQNKASYALKLPQATGRFSVELVRGPVGFGLTLSGGRNLSGDAPLAVRGLLTDGPAQRCGRLQVSSKQRSIHRYGPYSCPVSICPSCSYAFLQAGDLVLYINGQSTQGLTHAQVVERIRTGGPRLCLVLQRPQQMDGSRSEEVGGHQKTGKVVDFPERQRSERGRGGSESGKAGSCVERSWWSQWGYCRGPVSG